jgi:pimeloyl-ACP methyl ester carboxylesterase
LNPHKVDALIDSRHLYGFLSGEGEPIVILDAGLGDHSQVWQNIRPEVARFTKVLSYDRAGMGQSDKAPIPRTCKDMVEDLRRLLHAADLRPPYILVAHSWSGINARWYANQYPNELAGMVLIDPVHEDKYARFEKILSEERSARMWASVKDPSRNDENIDRIASIRQVQGSQCVFDFPLIVLTRATDTDEMNIIETSLQAEFLKLSSRSQQYFSKHDDHFGHTPLFLVAIRPGEPTIQIGGSQVRPIQIWLQQSDDRSHRVIS